MVIGGGWLWWCLVVILVGVSLAYMSTPDEIKKCTNNTCVSPPLLDRVLERLTSPLPLMRTRESQQSLLLSQYSGAPSLVRLGGPRRRHPKG